MVRDRRSFSIQVGFSVLAHLLLLYTSHGTYDNLEWFNSSFYGLNQCDDSDDNHVTICDYTCRLYDEADFGSCKEGVCKCSGASNYGCHWRDAMASSIMWIQSPSYGVTSCGVAIHDLDCDYKCIYGDGAFVGVCVNNRCKCCGLTLSTPSNTNN